MAGDSQQYSAGGSSANRPQMAETIINNLSSVNGTVRSTARNSTVLRVGGNNPIASTAAAVQRTRRVPAQYAGSSPSKPVNLSVRKPIAKKVNISSHSVAAPSNVIRQTMSHTSGSANVGLSAANVANDEGHTNMHQSVTKTVQVKRVIVPNRTTTVARSTANANSSITGMSTYGIDKPTRHFNLPFVTNRMLWM